ncbi:MAG: putative lipid II flippase FtsW [Pseudomonadota bacterium]
MNQTKLIYDKYLLFAALALLAIGLTMVASASMMISQAKYHQPFHFFFHQLVYIILGLLLAIVVLRIRILFWENISGILLLSSFIFLILVLIPHVGHRINGSARWIGVGPLRLQVSEYAKFVMIIYLSGYLVRHRQEVEQQLSGFLKPLFILMIMACLLLLEPDFGATVVISLTTFSMIFLAGARLRLFIVLLLLAVVALSILAVSSPYRLLRLTTFLDPWANQYHSGYQLVQSLIAFGRGGIFGVGLGDSIQKLFYLPEAHTDFLFAVLAEELGLVGILVVIALYVLLVWRALNIGRRAQQAGFLAAGYMAFGIAIWIAMQAFINMGVDAGMLPTKGLTLPLMSYGGSSILLTCMAIGLLLRVDYETRTSGAIYPARTSRSEI